MDLKLNSRTGSFAAAAVLLLMAALGALLYRNLSQWSEAETHIRHTREAIRATDDLLYLVRVAESEVRAYAITGNAETLRDFNKASLSLESQLRFLKRLEREHQPQGAAGLENLTRERKAALEATVLLRRTGRLDQAAIGKRIAAGDRLTAAITAAVASFQEAERKKLWDWETEARSASSQRGRLVMIAVVFVLILALGALVLLLHAARRRQAAEEELERSHAQLQGVLDAAHQFSIISTDPEGRIRVFNSGAEKMLGYTAAEILGKTPAAFHLPEEVAARAAELSLHLGRPVAGFETFVAVSRTAPYERREWTYVRKDGHRLQVELVVTAVRDAHGAIMGFLGVAADITARKKAQAQMRKLSAAVKHSPTSIVITDRDAKIEYANPKFYELTGFAEKETIGQNPRLLSSGSNPPELYGEMWKTLLAGRVWDGEFLNRKKNGEFFWEHASIAPVKDPSGAITNFIAVKVDITEAKLAQKEMEKARNAAVELARMKSEFLANMSHEIRTPMNAIIGMTGLLHDTQLTQRQRDYVSTISTAGEALLDIINDILDYSKIESGKIQIETMDFDVRETLESTLDLLAPRAQAKGLELAYYVADAVPQAVRGDAGRLRQVLLNFVGNAIKFTESGEIVVKAEDAGRDGNRRLVRFSVRDTGIGIAPEAQKALFNAFIQADASTTRKYGGTGLGLSISKRLTELMGGRVGLASEPGKGSTFWFELPLEETEAKPRRQDSSALAGLKILAVDDNAASREIVAHYLAAWGMAQGSASSAAEALRLLREAAAAGAPYRLLLTDMQMPEMDGLMLTAAVRAEPALAGTLVVTMTSLGRDLTPEERAASGIAAAVHKPLRPAALLAALNSALSPSPQEPVKVENPAAPKRSEARYFRILLAEDNAVNQKVAIRQLERLGYECDLAGNGLEALEAVRRRPYDLILMDCQMPEMDGFQATAEIRRTEAGQRHTVIVAMTANALEGDREKCLAAGMDGYLSKPVRLEELAAALAQWDTSLDKAVLKDLADLGGDSPDFMAELAATFLKDLPARLEAIKSAAAAKEAEALRVAAHTLKGSSGNIGAQRLQKICLQFELAGKSGSPDEALPLLPDLESEAAAVSAELQKLAGGR